MCESVLFYIKQNPFKFCPPPFRREKRGTGIFSICSFVHLSIRTKLCGRCNSATTGLIPTKSSSLELFWPVDVKRHAHLPIRPLEPCSQAGDPPVICLFSLFYLWINSCSHLIIHRWIHQCSAVTEFVAFHCWQIVIESEWRIYASLNWAIIGSDNGFSPNCH